MGLPALPCSLPNGIDCITRTTETLFAPEPIEEGWRMSLVKVQNKDGKDIYLNVDHIDFMEDKGQGIWRVVIGDEGVDLYYDWIKEILRSSSSPKPEPISANDGTGGGAFNAFKLVGMLK
jgi:hypothetical protein